jgi:hypothetical protein
MNFKSLFAWVYRRYLLGFNFAGSIMAVFNFVGIFTLLLQEFIGIPKIVLIPLLVLCGVFGFFGIAFLLVDILKMQTHFTEKDGQMNEYWNTKLTPIQQKTLELYLDAIENPKKIKKLKEKIKSGYL